MSVTSLIGSALELTGQILQFVSDNRGWKIKKEIETLLEEINVQETLEGDLRDDQALDELRDALNIKLRLFSSFLAGQDFQSKNSKILPED